MVDNIGSELHRIMEGKKLVKKDIAEKVGMSASQLNGLRENKQIYVSTFVKLCKAIGVPPSHFFEDEDADVKYKTGDISNTSVAGVATVNVGGGDDSIKNLRELLAEKERTIQILQKLLGVDGSVK